MPSESTAEIDQIFRLRGDYTSKALIFQHILTFWKVQGYFRGWGGWRTRRRLALNANHKQYAAPRFSHFLLKHYSHIRMEAKRRALEAIVPKSEGKAAGIAPSVPGEPTVQVQAVRATAGTSGAVVN